MKFERERIGVEQRRSGTAEVDSIGSRKNSENMAFESGMYSQKGSVAFPELRIMSSLLPSLPLNSLLPAISVTTSLSLSLLIVS